MNDNAPGLLADVRPGDRVKIIDRFGKVHAGRCVMKFATHCVLNMGGAHGRPAVADNDNIVGVVKAKERRPERAIG